MPDRYGDAVHARRAELRAMRAQLGGGHRGELRSCLALSRLAVMADIDAALAELAREAGPHIDSPRRQRLPDLLSTAVANTAADIDAAWAAALRPPLRRIATERGLAMPPGWPRLPLARLRAAVGPPEPVRVARSLLAGVADGAALWRLALFPLAALPLLGLPALGGPAMAPLAVGAATAAVVGAAWERRRAGERVRWRSHVDGQLAAVRAAVDADVTRRLLELERTAGAALDAAVERRRAEVEAELVLLAPTRSAAVARD